MTVSSPSAQTTTYAYDTANRLLSGVVGSSTEYAYGYDKASNLTSITSGGTTGSYTYSSTNAITSGTYDGNGSPLSLGGNTYKWDGANRLVHFTNTSAGTASAFVYDGMGRLVRAVDTANGAITADHTYLWCGYVRCAAHDNTQMGSPISTRYFDQGAIISGTAYYYLTDELGSVNGLVTSSGSVASQFTYDPYGNRTTVSGTVLPDVGYAGYFYHAVSRLDFALYRAYDSVHARWLNRDPIGEAGGINLYAYVGGNPISYVDPLGLVDINLFPPTSPLYNYENLTPSPPGTITVAGHSNPYDISDAAGNRLSANALAQIVRSSRAWRPGMTVQLLACNTGRPLSGRPNIAQQLAKILNTQVQAANNFVWFKTDGSYDIAGVNAPGVDYQNYTEKKGLSGENPNQPGGLIPYGP